MHHKIAAITMAVACAITTLPTRADAGADTRGEVVFSDALYGSAIGGIVGGAAWLIDQNDAGAKIGTGLLLGTVAGALFGIADSQSVVEIDHGAVKLALPTPAVQPTDHGLTYTVGLLRLPFE